MKIGLGGNPTNTLLEQILDLRVDRDAVADTYFRALQATERPDWSMINRAIVKRWSPAALRYIRQRAHRLMFGGEFNGH